MKGYVERTSAIVRIDDARVRFLTACAATTARPQRHRHRTTSGFVDTARRWVGVP
jgi:hypothetical protein